MKTALFILLAALAVGLPARPSTTQAGFEEVSFTVSIDSAAMDVGEERFVQLRLTDVVGAVGAWQIDIAYDPSVTSVIECIALANSVCNPNATQRSVRVAGANAAGLTDDRTLAVLSFRCDSAGTSPLTLEVAVGAAIPIAFEVDTRDGSITCEEPSAAPATSTPSATPTFSLPAAGSADLSDRAQLGRLIAAASAGLGLIATLLSAYVIAARSRRIR